MTLLNLKSYLKITEAAMRHLRKVNFTKFNCQFSNNKISEKLMLKALDEGSSSMIICWQDATF
ncbi:unnamed protein product [Moneuplotes crassus]|uniref:Uncharacterized protein n=1 Tax=Euplotes crassus TaxID=5936 RepID=A0AAD2D293_EUPCR|nr:unnamed protein product [Moneuplotes crassus]